MRGRKQCDPVNGCGKLYKPNLDACPSCKTPECFSTLIPYNPLDWIYDLECYPNIFTAAFKHPATGVEMFFEISQWINQLNDLVAFLHILRDAGSRLIGFNNVGYDYPMLHFILNHCYAGITYEDIFRRNDAIINTPWENRFNNLIWESETIITQIDLFRIHHFDNQSRRTSLKMLEFNMRSQNIKDLPFPPDTILTAEQRPVLIYYNKHDANETEKFYFQSLEMIEFREQLGITHNKNFLNHSDKAIGTTLFIDALEKNAPGSCYMYVNGKKTKRQTIRPSIRLADIIFPYINFNRPEFKRVHDWLNEQVITKTKGVFEYLDVTPEMAMSMDPTIIKVHGLTYADVPSLKDVKTTHNQIRSGMLLSNCKSDLINRTDLHRFKFVSGWKDQSGLNCIINGFQFDFGTGGIHGSIASAIVHTDDDYVIYDWDVAGYYPSLGAANNLFPEHLSNQFGVVDAMLKEERSKYKKGTPLNKAIKLARNGAYGDSNSKYSPFFDSQYTMSITINGQLLLCLLAEHLMNIPGLEMVQVNTDGLTVRCPRGYIDHMKQVCKWWEGYTCLELESAIYSRMFIRDVNNYIAEYEDGKLKRKGAYEYKQEWHQNHSQLVVARAAEAALIRGVDITHFIYNHEDIFDFMLRTKVARSEKLVIKHGEVETQLQNITRYYIGTTGGAMTKISPPAKGHKVGSWKRATKLTDSFYDGVINELTGQNWDHWPDHDIDSTGLPWDERINTKNRSKYEIRKTSFNAGKLVAPCNDIRDANRSNIDFNYYIEETKKLVDPLIN